MLADIFTSPQVLTYTPKHLASVKYGIAKRKTGLANISIGPFAVTNFSLMPNKHPY